MEFYNMYIVVSVYAHEEDEIANKIQNYLYKLRSDSICHSYNKAVEGYYINFQNENRRIKQYLCDVDDDISYRNIYWMFMLPGIKTKDDAESMYIRIGKIIGLFSIKCPKYRDQVSFWRITENDCQSIQLVEFDVTDEGIVYEDIGVKSYIHYIRAAERNIATIVRRLLFEEQKSTVAIINGDCANKNWRNNKPDQNILVTKVSEKEKRLYFDKNVFSSGDLRGTVDIFIGKENR